MMPFFSDDLDEKEVIDCTVVPTESACGAVISDQHRERAQDAGSCARDRGELKEKTVLAPPTFIFQRMAPSMKRRAERWEEGSVLGVSPNKRVRSFTYPSPRSRNDSCDRSSRTRSTSISFPTPPPASARTRRSVLRPALLLAPQPRSMSTQPHLSEVNHDKAGDLCTVTKNRPSSSSLSPQVHRPEGNVSTSDRIQFVFGENMSERVLTPQKTAGSESESDCSSSESDYSESSHKVWSSLRESAAAHTSSSRRRHLLRHVQLFTGEEKESKVVQMTCRLFVLEKGTHSWSERGRGILRLNDLASGPKGSLQSRIVMRHQGSFKVILNTKLWPHTHLCRPGRRNLQVTATDVESQAVRVFLVQAGARDVARLYVAIHHRLVALRCEAAGLEAEGSLGARRDREGQGARPREGHCNSENEEEEEDEEEEERQRDERLLVTRLRPVACDWIHSKPSLGSW